jgi:hypothetical protein
MIAGKQAMATVHLALAFFFRISTLETCSSMQSTKLLPPKS